MTANATQADLAAAMAYDGHGPSSREAEVQEVLACLRESLRDPAFAGALALLLAMDGRDAERRRKPVNGSE
jgi:hypothetical protein